MSDSAAQVPHRGFYSFYNAGKVNGAGPDLIMFNVYKRDGSYGSSHCVEIQDAGRNREALIGMGYQPRAKATEAAR